MWFPNAFWPAFFAVGMGALILALILRSGIKRPGNIPAFILFTAFFLWSFGEMLERLAGPPPADEAMAFLGARVLFIGIALSPAAFIHFSVEYPYMLRMGERSRKGVMEILYGISAFFAVLGLFNPGAVIFQGVEPYSGLGQEIWGLDEAPLYTIYTFYVLIAALAFIGIMEYKYMKTDMKIIKDQIILSLTGFFLAVVLVTASSLIPTLYGQSSYPLTTISFTLFSLFVLYTILRYRTFLVSPGDSSGTDEKGIFIMDRRKAEERFASSVKRSVPGIAFVFEDPEGFRKRHGLRDIPVFQITEEAGKDRLNPLKEEHREMMKFIILSFGERAKSPVILLNIKKAVEALASPEEYKKIVKDLKALAESTEGTFIVAE